MNIPEMIMSAILKKGILYEATNVDAEFEIPKIQVSDGEVTEIKIKVYLKADNMTLKIEREDKV